MKILSGCKKHTYFTFTQLQDSDYGLLENKKYFTHHYI